VHKCRVFQSFLGFSPILAPESRTWGKLQEIGNSGCPDTRVSSLRKAITDYLSGYAGDADHRYVFYAFRPSRSRDGPKEVLANYRGYLQTDGHIVYTSLVREADDGQILT
jgi:hypothetical protein